MTRRGRRPHKKKHATLLTAPPPLWALTGPVRVWAAIAGFSRCTTGPTAKRGHSGHSRQIRAMPKNVYGVEGMCVDRQSPYRLAVRTSCRSSPGLTSGKDMYASLLHECRTATYTGEGRVYIKPPIHFFAHFLTCRRSPKDRESSRNLCTHTLHRHRDCRATKVHLARIELAAFSVWGSRHSH